MSECDAEALAARYRDYIDCLNRRALAELGRFVHDDVQHNARPLGLSGYVGMLEGDYRDIPDLHFHIALLVTQPPHVAARLTFDCAPKGRFMGLDVDGRRVVFSENVFYKFEGGKIREVWSVIDKAAIEGQLKGVS